MAEIGDDVAGIAARLKKLYAAAVYDIMDEMGLPNQCLDLAIKPLDRRMRVAGPAFTVACSADMRLDSEYVNEEVRTFKFFRRMTPGCVVIVSSGGESQGGHWGELMSMSSKARGATGIIVDGGIRDGNILMGMDDWPAFARYLSPIESRKRTRIHDIQGPLAVGGSLTSQVRVDPGDWLFGDMDGVLVIPKAHIGEVLQRSEDIGGIEDKVRDEIKAGADVSEVFAKYGRL